MMPIKYSFDSDSGLEQVEKVKGAKKLTQFAITNFLEEIEVLKNEGEYKQARLLLKLAEHKIEKTGKEAGTEEYSKKEILELIYEAIWEIEIDSENFYNIDFDANGEPKDIFEYSFYQVDEIINVGQKAKLNAIEIRMLQEGYFNNDGTWNLELEALIYLIKILELKKFFKRRTPKGRWYTTTDYVWFFESRYGVDLSKYYNYGELAKLEEKDYIPWLKEY